MTDYNKVFLDTAPFIYFIEKDNNNPQYFDKMKQFFETGYQDDKEFVTSTITITEYFVVPYRKQELSCISSFQRLVETLDIEIVRRHIVGGANRTLFSANLSPRLCRIGTCRRLSAD